MEFTPRHHLCRSAVVQRFSLISPLVIRAGRVCIGELPAERLGVAQLRPAGSVLWRKLELPAGRYVADGYVAGVHCSEVLVRVIIAAETLDRPPDGTPSLNVNRPH
jgi:hypothetical protein